MAGREVLDDQQRSGEIGGQGGEDVAEGGEPAGRGGERHDVLRPHCGRGKGVPLLVQAQGLAPPDDDSSLLVGTPGTRRSRVFLFRVPVKDDSHPYPRPS
jgi:hypothetical protein